jgi:hypothetical protein
MDHRRSPIGACPVNANPIAAQVRWTLLRERSSTHPLSRRNFMAEPCFDAFCCSYSLALSADARPHLHCPA